MIERKSNRRTLVISILVSIITIIAMSVLTQFLVYDVYGDFTMPDMQYGYSPDRIQTAFDGLGVEGLNAWVLAHSPDFIFPLAYSFAMMIGIVLELRKLEISGKRFRLIMFIPVTAGIADYIENFLILSQVYSYPTLSVPILLASSIVTQLKWSFLILGFVIIVVLLILTIERRIER